MSRCYLESLLRVLRAHRKSRATCDQSRLLIAQTIARLRVLKLTGESE